MRHIAPAWLCFGAACATALALRLLSLGERLLHHDEAMGAWVCSRVLQGFQLAYDPERFHGPFLLVVVFAVVTLLGDSELWLRLPAALASTAMLPLLLPLRHRLGSWGVAAAAWLLALSPAFVAYGRTLIPETFLACLTLALVGATVVWLDTRRPRSLLFAAFVLGLLATVKETYVLTLGGLVLGAAAAWWLSSPRPQPRELVAGVSRRLAGRALLAFAVPYVLLYTSGFSYPRGLPDSLRTFALWAEKGIRGAGHAKPWDYYLRLLVSWEPLLLAALLGGAWLALRRRHALAAFCVVWAAAELVAYSLLRYKTPWLVLNVLLPAALAGGALAAAAASWRASRAARTALSLALLLGLGWSAWRAADVAFLRHDDTRLQLVYVPTQRGAGELVTHVRRAARPTPRGAARVRIYGRHAWPLPWYLRDLPDVAYLHDLPARLDAEVLVVEGRLEPRLRPLLRGRFERRRFLLRPGVPYFVYVDGRVQAPVPAREPEPGR